MTLGETPSQSKRNYFVDEAGDPVLFNSRKQVVVGKEGCSRYFVLGLLDVADPEALAKDLTELRNRLLADPYFKGVPSMQPERRKTALAFHAKDDMPEVRREVFALLLRHQLRFFALIRDKRRIAHLVKEHNCVRPTYRYHQNHLYDQCVGRLFKERLHKDEGYRIVFAKRGTSDRTSAFRLALENARNNLRRSWGIETRSPIEVVASIPHAETPLQATDYYLWALQRLLEGKKEERYLQLVWQHVGLIHDVDDVSKKEYGVYYTQRNALTLEQWEKRSPGI